MNDSRVTAIRSTWNPDYYIVRLDGKAWRVCHRLLLASRWPGIHVVEAAS